MNRQIKFRAWDKKGKQMIDWPVNVYTDEDGPWWSADYIDERGQTIGSFDGKTGVLMQFTGLHDINGVEIFEGDIVISQRNGEEEGCTVSWNEDEARFNIFWYDNPEIIGNIYESPELLK